jgi:hypothetical protein
VISDIAVGQVSLGETLEKKGGGVVEVMPQ